MLTNSYSTYAGFKAALDGKDLGFVRPSWDKYFMALAKMAATRSNCLSRLVGAVIVQNDHVIATGYNGTPYKMENCDMGSCDRCLNVVKSGEKLTECFCLHAEESAIL